MDVPLAAAETVTVVSVETVPAVAVNAAVVPPAATVTEAGTLRKVLSSETETGRPPVGAALFRVTVQVAVAPDSTLAGEQVSVDGTAGATRVSEALAVLPLRLEVTSAVLLVVTVDAEAVKVAVKAPAATLIDAGVVTKVLLSESVTATPPAGAAAFRVIVQVALPAPVIEEGLQDNEDSPTGVATWSETTPPVADVAMPSPAREEAPGLET